MNKQLLKELLQSEKDSFILFYSDDCIHCGIAKPILQEHASKKMVPVYKIEEVANNEHIFDIFGVDSYPTLFHIKSGRLLKYEGVDSIVQMIKNSK
jgi:thioredoxin-related protein